jgi:CBS domain containing-hemolysin-like protein
VNGTLGWDVTLVVFLVALCGTAFFSGCETGYMSVSRARLLRSGAMGGPRGRLVVRQIARIEDAILTCLIGTNLFNVLGTAVVTVALTTRFGARGEWMALVGISAVIIVFGEILPKVVYREHPERLMLWSAPLAAGAMAVIAPLRWLLHAYTSLLDRVLPRRGAQGGFDRRSLAALLLSNTVPSGGDQRFAELVERFLRLAHRSLGELSISLQEVVAVPANATVAECLAVAARSGHSRLPVLDDDEVTSYVLVRDLLLLPEEDRARRLPRRLRRPLPLVDDRLSPYEMFEEVRGQGRQIALVCDAHGNPQGLLTLEDLIEAVVGAIADEFDPPAVAGVQREDADHD